MAKKNHDTISVRRSSGRKEKFEIDRMPQITSRSGVPFLMARDIAKNTSNKLTKEAAEGRLKENTVTADQMRVWLSMSCRIETSNQLHHHMQANPRQYTKRLDWIYNNMNHQLEMPIPISMKHIILTWTM
jgi:hypothetical protein